jgi:hypothetical protein
MLDAGHTVKCSRTDFAARIPTVVHWMSEAAKPVRFQIQRLRKERRAGT